MGKYSLKNIKKKKDVAADKPRACYYCGQEIKTTVIGHIKNCRGRTSKCNFWEAIGHYEVACRKEKAINRLEPDSQLAEPTQADTHPEEDLYHINLFRITDTMQQQKPNERAKTQDFKAQ